MNTHIFDSFTVPSLIPDLFFFLDQQTLQFFYSQLVLLNIVHSLALSGQPGLIIEKFETANGFVGLDEFDDVLSNLFI